jgi:zinc D-Ala-D-Ala carboxypeptidase
MALFPMKRTKKNIDGLRSLAVMILLSLSLLFVSYMVKHTILQPLIDSRTSPSREISKSQHTESKVVSQAASKVASQPAQSSTQSQSSNLGHFAYGEDDASRLMTIASYAQGEYQRFERVDQDAGLALMKMIYAARDESVWIVPVSGFRNTADQQLLFERQIQKLGSPEAAAKLSAPPGHSEHHTGYAIDLADGTSPKADITYQFDNSNAFRWLQKNAGKFGFEMSFVKGNRQGVSYEPWHWRFVGSEHAKATFAEARKQQ